MSDRSSVGSRLRTLLADLLLSFLNATLVLVVVALVLTIVVINKAEGLRRSVVRAITAEIVAPVEVQAREIKARIENLNRTLALRGPRPRFDSERDDQAAGVADQIRQVGQRVENLSRRAGDFGQ